MPDLSLLLDDVDGGASVALDLGVLLKTRALVQASSGGGKSYLLRYLLERTAGRVQHLVIDPEGEFVSLRERHPYVVVGEGGDVAARVETAGPLARALVEAGASAVLDLYALRLGDRRRFVRGFLEGLLALPRALWRPALVVIDEAHRFAPERGGGEAESLDAVVTLCTQGRKRGLGAVLATQRLSKLHKDAAAELLNVFVGRTGLDVDVRRSADALGLDRGGRAELKALRPGDFFGVGPALAADGVVRVRAGAVETRHPEPGGLEVSAGAVPPPPEELRTALAALAALEPETAPEAEGGGGDERLREALRQADARASAAESETAQLRQRLRHALEAAETLRGVLMGSDTGEEVGGPQRGSEAPVRARPAPESAADPAPPAGANRQDPSRPHRKILSAVRLFEALGVPEPEKANVAVWAGYRPSSGSYTGHLAEMKRRGWVEYPGGRLALTEAGRGLVPAPETPMTLEDLHAAWLAKLSEPQARILRVILDAYPLDLYKEGVARGAGYSEGSGSFTGHLASLRALGVIDYPVPGRVQVTPLLYPGRWGT